MFLITTISSEAKLLPHFLAYYHRLGVDRFLLVADPLRNPGFPDVIRQMARNYPAEVYLAQLNDHGYRDANVANALRKRYFAKDDWCMLADLDEFFEFPVPLAAITASNPCDYVAGDFLDRITADGSFPEIGETSLWSQFPLGCLLTQNVARAVSTKVMMIKGPDIPVTGGHHRALSGVPFPRRGAVHHFKWSAGLVERLKSKIEAQKGHNLACWPNSARLLDFVQEKNRIEVEDPRIQARPARNPFF